MSSVVWSLLVMVLGVSYVVVVVIMVYYKVRGVWCGWGCVGGG